MRKGEIPTELSLLAFDFFYSFSRFEFCLKNLFHGGKHGAAGWDSPERTHSLITWSAAVLECLVETGDFRGDYERLY
ncbi:hypothetical protein [Pseudomonas sp. S1Bt23]|uniref:hypothetical protein n=1 Tax=Pseudomonas sp. S1Bt23 TaxID=3095074 RepID=UPI002A5AD516|nr:hypothetical protein [Pseudomonas sp. S1Bt23]WPO48667.1 hypothetical protein SHB59_06195 [Pseudomonas sp. S1Bt23]